MRTPLLQAMLREMSHALHPVLNSAWRSIQDSEASSALRVASLMVFERTLLPRVDDCHREIFKMDHVASCQSRMACNHDASDHGVTQINRPTLALPEGHQVCGFHGRSIIERSDSATHFLEDGFKGLQQQSPSFPGRHNLKSKPNLQDCH